MRRRRVIALAAGLGLCTAAACTGAIMDPPASPGPEVDPLIASEVVVRRLTQAELDRSLRDLLGDDTNPARRLLGEDEFNPYDNDYTLQRASEALIDNLEVMSREVAESLIADPARRDRLVGCTPTGPGDEACFRSFVSSFLRRAFRRDVSTEEVEPYVTELLPYATEDNPDVENDF